MIILIKKFSFFLKLNNWLNRNNWGDLYLIVRGEILGFLKDKHMRKHFTRVFPLIKNESWGIEDDQTPS